MLTSSFNLLMSQFIALGLKLDVMCKQEMANLETYAEPNMRLTIVGIEPADVSDVVKVRVSYAKYDEYNKQFESHNYYGGGRVACLGPRESGDYRVEDSIYFDRHSNPNDYFSLIPEANKLLDLYSKRADIELTYVQWLESIVLNCHEHHEAA